MFFLLVSLLFAAIYFTSPTPRPRKDAQSFSFTDYRNRLNSDIGNRLNEDDKFDKLKVSKQNIKSPKQDAQIIPFRKPKK